jgi:hypothetical protein
MKNLLDRTLFFTAIFAVAYFLFSQQVYAPQRAGRAAVSTKAPYDSDMASHTQFCYEYMQGTFRRPHPVTQLAIILTSKILRQNIEASTPITLALFAVLAYFILYKVLSTSLAGLYSDGYLMFITGCLVLLSGIYVPFFNQHVMYGQSSPNLWHNPPLVVVKPMAFLTTLLMIRFINNEPEQKKWWNYVVIPLLLVLSCYTKPNYAFVMIPATVIYVVIGYSTNLRLHVKVALLLAPALAVLCLQYFSTYQHDGATDRIHYDFLGVWRLMSPNVGVSILLVLAFPLAVLSFRFNSAVRNRQLMFSWLLTGIAIAQFALFAEDVKYGHGNFSWGYAIVLPLLFVFSTCEFLRWLRGPSSPRPCVKLLVVIAAVLFSLHVYSGVFYFIYMLSGGSYIG